MPDTIRVLYVDDEPALLELGKVYLEELGGIHVTTATSATEALASPTLLSYHVIVSDYLMPDTDGIVFLKELRKRSADLPFILYTGRGREEIVIEAINNGADFYLQKGGTPGAQFAELAHKIRQADRRYRIEQALRESEERYRSIVDDQEEMIARFTPDGVITFVNRAICDYFRAAAGFDLAVGKKIGDLVPEQNYHHLVQFLGQLTRDKPADQVERGVPGKNGVQHWQTWSARALFAPDGTPREYQVVGHDVTRLKNTEEELRAAYERLATRESELKQQYRLLALNESILAEREEAYRTFFEQSPAAITLTTMNGEYVDVNPQFCELVDLPRSVLIGRTPREIWPSSGSEYTNQIVYAFDQAGGVLDRHEIVIPSHGGSPLRCRISTRLIQYRNTPHVLALIYDAGTDGANDHGRTEKS